MPEDHDTKPLDAVGAAPWDKIPGFRELPAEEQVIIQACAGDQPMVNAFLMTKIAEVKRHSEGVVTECKKVCTANDRRFKTLERFKNLFAGATMLLVGGWALLKFVFTGK